MPQHVVPLLKVVVVCRLLNTTTAISATGIWRKYGITGDFAAARQSRAARRFQAEFRNEKRAAEAFVHDFGSDSV
jgi:hypothetical protein